MKKKGKLAAKAAQGIIKENSAEEYQRKRWNLPPSQFVKGKGKIKDVKGDSSSSISQAQFFWVCEIVKTIYQ